MKKLLIIPTILFVVTLSILSTNMLFAKSEVGSVDPDTKSFATLSKKKIVKTVNYFCSFQNVVDQKFLMVGDFCQIPDRKQLDYVSYFIPNDFQQILLRSNDFILNLNYFMDKQGKNLFKTFLLNYTSKGEQGVSDKIFDNATPTSFVSNYNGTLRFFIGKKDLFLRDTIYPSYKLLALIPPAKKEDEKLLTDYLLKYSVYPFTMTTDYRAKWVSYITGAPMFDEAEWFMENDRIQFVKDYFKRMEDFVAEQAMKYYNFSDDNFTTASTVYPYLFIKQIKDIKVAKHNQLIPAIPKENEGYIFDYLPSYKLSKIEIIVINDQTKVETVLKTFTQDDISETYLNNKINAGLIFDTFKLKSSTYQIRYTHIAQAPKYDDAGYMRIVGSGLAYIYSSLGYTIVTNLNVVEEHDMKTLPIKCLKDQNIEKILNGLNVPAVEIKKILSPFTNTEDSCNQLQALTTGIITEIK